MRFITINGLYAKGDTPDLILKCNRGVHPDCGNERAKELRFCAVVMYYTPHQGLVTVCSLMTNFLK